MREAAGNVITKAAHELRQHAWRSALAFRPICSYNRRLQLPRHDEVTAHTGPAIAIWPSRSIDSDVILLRARGCCIPHDRVGHRPWACRQVSHGAGMNPTSWLLNSLLVNLVVLRHSVGIVPGHEISPQSHVAGISRLTLDSTWRLLQTRWRRWGLPSTPATGPRRVVIKSNQTAFSGWGATLRKVAAHGLERGH